MGYKAFIKLANPDHDLLGVDSSASPEEVKKAYRRKASLFHPDKNPGNKAAEAKMKEINAAYERLSGKDKRTVNDWAHTTQQNRKQRSSNWWKDDFASGRDYSGGNTKTKGPGERQDFKNDFNYRWEERRKRWEETSQKIHDEWEASEKRWRAERAEREARRRARIEEEAKNYWNRISRQRERSKKTLKVMGGLGVGIAAGVGLHHYLRNKKKKRRSK